MRSNLFLFCIGLVLLGCKSTNSENSVNIIFLHHSTGQCIWDGKASSVDYSIKTKTSTNKKNSSFNKWIKEYNKTNNTNYIAEDLVFPKDKPYGWANFPYDYYNIWVKNAGESPYNEEPTLEMLTKKYNVVIFKHCFPVSNVTGDTVANIDSDVKSIGNYKLQYAALKEKLYQFSNTKFILWTGAAQVKNKTSEEEAIRAKEFFDWVKKEWDQENDNIFLWDFRSLQTEDGLYFKDEYATSATDSHPNKEFSEKVVPLFGQRVTDVIENNGSKTNLKGELL
jgi:hypothetical protein